MTYEVNIELLTPREIIERDRKKYKSITLKLDRDRWILKLYGDKLDISAEIIYEERIKTKDFRCRICKEPFDIDEKFARLNFSFCDEYGCGMDIHLDARVCLDNRGIDYYD